MSGSILETIAATSMIASGYGTLGTSVAIGAAAGMAYGVKIILTGESKLAKIITKKELGYEPKSLEKKILNIVSEQ